MRAAAGAALMLRGGGCRGRQSSPGSTPARPQRPTSQTRGDGRTQGGFGGPHGCGVAEEQGWWGGLGGAGAFAALQPPTPADLGGASWGEQGFLRPGWTPVTTGEAGPVVLGPVSELSKKPRLLNQVYFPLTRVSAFQSWAFYTLTDFSY